MRIISAKAGNSKVAFIHGNTGEDPNLVIGLDALNSTNKIVVYDSQNGWQNFTISDNKLIELENKGRLHIKLEDGYAIDIYK